MIFLIHYRHSNAGIVSLNSPQQVPFTHQVSAIYRCSQVLYHYQWDT